MRKFVSFVLLISIAVYFLSCGSRQQGSEPIAKESAAAELVGGDVETNGISLTGAPWVDGEMMRLKITSLRGDEIGTTIYTAVRDRQDGEDIWRIISQNYISSSDSPQDIEVKAKLESFRPLLNRTISSFGDFTAEYSNGKVQLHGAGAAGEVKKDVDVNSVVYDNNALIHLVRRLPLKEDFKTSFALFAIMSGSVVDCSIAVVGKEQVAVPTEKFDCYRVNLTMREGQQEPLEHSMWVSADERRYPVKYIAGLSMILELAEVSQPEKDVPLTFEDTELGCSFAVPYGWRFFKHKAGNGTFVELLSPQLKAKAALCVLPAAAWSDAIDIAKRDAETMAKLVTGYTVRVDEFKQVSVGQLKAIQYTADFTEENKVTRKPKEMAEYRTYVVSGQRVYFFVFRTEKEKFDSLKSEFDAIIQSFELKKQQL